MSEDNNKPWDNLDKKPKTPIFGEGFEAWMRWQEEHKNFVELKNQLDTHAQLADLRESLWSPWKKSPEKQTYLSPSFTDRNSSWNKEDIAFTEQIFTRKAGDEKKNVIQWVLESFSVPFRVIKDGVFDLTRVVTSPIKETKTTIALLESESTAKII